MVSEDLCATCRAFGVAVLGLADFIWVDGAGLSGLPVCFGLPLQSFRATGFGSLLVQVF